MGHERNIVQIALLVILDTTKYTMKISTTTTGALIICVNSKGTKSIHITIFTSQHWVITGRGGYDIINATKNTSIAMTQQQQAFRS